VVTCNILSILTFDIWFFFFFLSKNSRLAYPNVTFGSLEEQKKYKNVTILRGQSIFPQELMNKLANYHKNYLQISTHL
jgi:hypothetical protein